MSKAWKMSAAIVALGLCGGIVLVAASGAHAQSVTTNNVRQAETEAGNLLADAVRAAGEAQIAFVPAVTFKTRVAAPRTPTPEQAAALLDSATDPIVVLSLKGEQVLAALERSVGFGNAPFAGFLQVSGLRFTFDGRNETGKRVVAVTVGGKPLDPGATYRVATTRALANGANGYFQIWTKEQIAADTGKTLRVALDEMARRPGGLSAALDGRIATAGS